MTWLMWADIIIWHVSLSYGGGGKSGGGGQGWLNASHFAKCSSGQYITREWTDRLKKRTERHQWSIVCSQDAPSVSSGSQYIKESQNILHHLHRYVLQIQITSFVFLWLNKSFKSSFVPPESMWSTQRTYTSPTKGLESIKSPSAITFQCE